VEESGGPALKMAALIDGSYGEGGGQVLRTALALAAILRRPVEIQNIRGGRKKPGLRPQHLAAVQALTMITSAHVQGAEQGSTHLYFEPRDLAGGTYRLDVGTAGSTSLVLQAIIPGLLFAKEPSQVTITGGTHVPWSPCFHYLRDVFAPALKEMGGSVFLENRRWGWYPKGGGEVIASISPMAALRAMERGRPGELRDAYLLSAVSNLAASIAERQRDQALKRFAAQGYAAPEVELLESPSRGVGTLVFIRARFDKTVAGFSSLGARGKPAEKVADEACSAFFHFVASRAAVDNHLSDQLVPYMALAKGHSSFVVGTITEHLMTNMWVIEQFLPVKFDVDREIGRVGVEGAGYGVSAPFSPV
jgi:RNA 3'-terminal phosphate cyclase (ATP)